MELTTEQLALRYERLRNEEVYKDVTLTSHDSVVSAHKCILSIGSEFFNLLFRQAERKKDMFHRSSFELVGLSAEDAKHLDAVIDFLYNGVIYMNNVNFTAIIKLADYLAIEELFDLAEKYLEMNVTKENCLKLYLDMKKSFDLDTAKVSSSSNRKSEDLLKMVWETVETNFYDHVIDHYEFLEVIPEEVKDLLQRQFDIHKVLKLALRWLKTWPLGFTFAQSLVNIMHGKLNDLSDENLTDKSKADIVATVTAIRGQVTSRSVPESNRINILRKLREIQAVFDDNNGKINSEEEIEAKNKNAETKGVSVETATELNGTDDTGKNKSGISIPINMKNSGDNHLDSRLEVNTNGNATVFTDTAVTSNVVNEPLNSPELNKQKDKDKGKQKFDDTVTETLIDSKLGKDSLSKRRAKLGESDLENSKDTCVSVYKDVSVIHDGSDKNDEDELVKYEDDIKEEKGEIQNSETLEQVVRGLQRAGPNHAALTERVKLDGTEVEVSASGDNSDSQEKSEESESTLHDRVAECLKLQRVVKKENENIGTQMTKIKPTKGKRKRGRPKKHVNAELEYEELKQDTAISNRPRTRGIKRKLVDCNYGISDSEDNDETVVKVEVNEEGPYMDEESQGAEPDIDKDSKSEAEGDSEDDYSEDIFSEALKQASGLNLLDPERKRRPSKPGSHECEICYKVFARKYRLTQHMNMHLGIKPYKCVVCLQKFSRSDHVVRHMRSQHSDVDVFKCDECDEEFDKVNELVTHLLIHIPQPEYAIEKLNLFTDAEKEFIEVSRNESGKQLYKCIKCDMKFRRPYQAREHINFHTGEKPFKCNLCDNAFSKKENLSAHIRAVHEGKRGEFRCEKCRRYFMKKETYDSHIEKCEPSYVCEHCPMKYYRKTHLDNHKSMHDLVPQHECPHCDNKFRYRKHMLRHIKKDHENEVETPVPCICDICGVIVKNKEALYRHKKVHKLPDKKCDVCGKAFKDNTTLKDHKLMHTNIRDYQCEICSMLFARKGNLIRHQKRHRGERKYKCEMCGMCFVANCDLTRHKNTHLGVKKFPCRYCGRKFSLRSKVVIHERTHTGERPYVCRDEGCGKTFKQTGDRVRHEKKVHSLTFNKYMTLYELATGQSEDIYKQTDNGASTNKVMILPANPSLEISAGLKSGANMNINTGLNPSQATDLSVSSSHLTNVNERPENGGASSQVIGSSSSQAASFTASSLAALDKSIINAATASFNPNMNNSFIEEAEMSKIFQKTVAAISQEAIAKSGIYD